MTPTRKLKSLIKRYAGNSLRILALQEIGKRDKAAEAENSIIMQAVNKELPPELVPHFLQVAKVIDKLCDTLADVDFEGFGVVIDLLDQAKKGQVLVVEKQEFDKLVGQ